MSEMLIVTCGQTDVQLVVDGVRHDLCKKCCAALHDEIERRTGSWRLVDPPNGKAASPIDKLPEGELILCTPRLDAVLREVVPTTALVLETRCDASAKPEDPRFAGAILESRLRANGVGTVHRHAFLKDAEHYDNRDDPRDAVIRRVVVQRLEHAVRDTIEAVKPSRVVIAAKGGFPTVTNLVEAIVRLFASVPVEALEVPDGTKASPPTADRAVSRTSVPEPIASYQARRTALVLIAKGNLLGAWAIAEPLHTDDIERHWTQVIEWLARFASSLPIPKACDIRVLSHARMAVRAALRVELALRAGDIPGAVHRTVAFFEAALWDYLGEKTSRHATRRQFKFHEPPAAELVRERDASRLCEHSKAKQQEDRKRPFCFEEAADGADWYRIDDSEICAIQIATRYLRLDSLAKLGQAMDRDIRELRNDVAHTEPTSALMDNARHRMQKASLWSSSDTFLSQPLVQDALRELGESHPEALCDELLDRVRRRLLAPLQP